MSLCNYISRHILRNVWIEPSNGWRRIKKFLNEQAQKWIAEINKKVGIQFITYVETNVHHTK